MEFEKETSFIHVDGEKILIFAIIAVLVLILFTALLINMGKVSITRAGNMSF